MAVTHETGLRNAIADAVDNYINTTGSGTAQLRLIDDSASPTVFVVGFNLQNPAFGAAAAGVITLEGVSISATADAAGTVDKGDITTRAGAPAIFFSVTGTGGGGDVEVSNTNITSSQACSLDSLTYTAPV